MLTEYLLASSVFILLCFFVFRVIVRRDYLNKQRLSRSSGLLEVLVFAVHANLMYLFIPAKWPNLPQLPENLIANILSFIVFCSGLIILLISWFNLGTETSFGHGKNELNTSGIYRYSRNPQLLGYGILLFSFVIIYFSWYSVGWMLLYLVASYFMVKSEEEFLTRRYGEGYISYCSDVPRTVKLF